MQAGIDNDEAKEVDYAVANAAMERYAAGDNEAFSDVYDALAPAVFDRLVTLTEDAALAEELAHKTLLRLHRARGRFIRGADVAPWAFSIADQVATENAFGLDVVATSFFARARRALGSLRAVAVVQKSSE